ncbi:hypothetical protein [uncultured Butyricimonas sp.]|uniref:hypothetical protein n=1 Tax=uncultured Butyricimonas sp. TaxID=1268785 RepID=UPI0026DD8E00|nr:hypothetical protein [uncultured Butyricimonas sp.]
MKAIDKISVEGVREVLELLYDYPKEIDKIAKSALRKAVAPLVRDVKRANPIKGVKISVKSLKSFNPGLKYGYFGEVGGNNRLEVSPWFKAYWKNYGTMSRRYPGHKFLTGVKGRGRGKGVRPRLFFENAVEGKENEVYDRFEKFLIEGVNKFLAQWKR